MGEWIKVEDRLPEFKRKVLGYSLGSERIYICYREIEDEYNEHWTICEDQDCSCVGCTAPISHWMPLPVQPERLIPEDGSAVCDSLSSMET